MIVEPGGHETMQKFEEIENFDFNQERDPGRELFWKKGGFKTMPKFEKNNFKYLILIRSATPEESQR